MQKNVIVTAIKGMCVGGTMLVPGVSGGSMAMILGVYDKLVSSVSSFMKHKKQSILFLGTFSIGAAIGMVLFAKPLLSLIERFPMIMLYFFIGAVAGGIPMIYEKASIGKFNFKSILYLVMGIAIVMLLSMVPKEVFNSQGESIVGIIFLVAAGIVAAIALVLPGISVSYMLLLMGMYDKTMKAISEFYLPYLLPIGIGIMIGIILTTRILEKAMTNHPQLTYMIILGFIIGSMIEVFPGVPKGFELIISLVMLYAGYKIIRVVSKIQN